MVNRAYGPGGLAAGMLGLVILLGPGCGQQGGRCDGDRDCAPGHLCREDGRCTAAAVASLEACRAIRCPAVVQRAFQRPRLSVLILLPGPRQDALWQEAAVGLQAMLEQAVYSNGFDLRLRLLTPAGEVIALEAIAGDVLDQERVDELAAVMTATLEGLDPPPSERVGLIRTAVQTAGRLEALVGGDHASQVLLLLLDDRDDCSQPELAAACDRPDTAQPIGELVAELNEAVAAMRPVLGAAAPEGEVVFRLGVFHPGPQGCSGHGRQLDPAPRYSALVQAMQDGPGRLSAGSISICDTHPAMVELGWMWDVTPIQLDPLPVATELARVTVDGMPQLPGEVGFLVPGSDPDEPDLLPIAGMSAAEVWALRQRQPEPSLFLDFPGPDYEGRTQLIEYCPLRW